MTQPAAAGSTPGRLFDASFARLTAVAFVFFMAMGATFPVLPRFVRDELGAGDTAVGVALGTMALGAILARPAIGTIGDRRGRRLLLVAGGLVSAVAMAGHLAVDGLGMLIVLRLVFGAGQGAVIVGATTLAVDSAPGDRSGEATSYVFVALHLGSGLGALLGEWLLQNRSFDAVWVMCAVAMSVSAVVALTLPRGIPNDPADTSLPMLHPRAVLPGIILGIGTLGFIGYNAFVPLFGDEIGVDNVAPYFLMTSLTIVAIRSMGARIPDRLGPRRGGSLALVVITAGLTIIGAWRTAVGLGVGSVVLASGTALLLPSLVTAAVDGVPAAQRSRAMATYTLFLEISAAVGGVLFGGVASVSTYGTAFLVAAGGAAVALVVLRLRLTVPPPPSAAPG